MVQLKVESENVFENLTSKIEMEETEKRSRRWGIMYNVRMLGLFRRYVTNSMKFQVPMSVHNGQQNASKNFENDDRTK